MKKFLVLLALCMVLSVVLVACQQPDDPTTDESTAGTTEAPTTEAPTTEAPTTEAPTTEEPTTEEPTTQAPTTEDTTEEPVVDPEPDPSAPTFIYGANDLNSIVNGAPDIGSAVASEDGSYLTITMSDKDANGMDPWFTIRNIGKNAKYVAVKYRTTVEGSNGNFFLGSEGSDATGNGDMSPIHSYVADGQWHVVLLDTSVVEKINDENLISFLRLDPYGNCEEGATFDLAWIAGFTTAQYAAEYYIKDTTFLLDPATIAGATPVNAVQSATVSEDGSYVTIVCDPASNGDIWLNLLSAPVQGAQYVVVKYRTTVGANGQFFVGSAGGPTGSGDCPVVSYTSDGAWHLGIADLAQESVTSVDKETYKLAYLRFDALDNGLLGNGTVDVAYIAAFSTIEEAQAYFDMTMAIADTSNTFKSDVDSNEVNASLTNADISSIMVLRPGTNGWKVVEIDGAKYYELTGIDAITADMDGAYYLKANIKDAINGSGIGFVVRGYNGTVSSDDNVPYKITNFYETDDAGFCGGSGIYAYVNNGKLSIVVKYYDAAKGTRVGNKIYNLACEGNELVMADNGYTVSIMVNGVTYATIDLSGSVAYEDITTTPAGGAFATKAVVTLKDGTTETIENTLVAATVNSQVGLTCRASQLRFSAIEVGGYTAIEVPALEIVEPEPVDPNAPIAEGNAEYLAGAASNGASQTTATLSEDGKYVTLTSGEGDPIDPNFWVLPGGSAIGGVQVIGLKYRTTVANGGEFFVGSTNITGGADEVKFDYIADGEWHVIYIDLTAHAAVVDGLVNYIRYDYFMNAAVGSTIDVESVVLFSSMKAAYAYYGETYTGTLSAPLTVGETLAAVGELAEGTTTAGKFFTTGVVTAIGKTGSYYGSVYFTDGENEMLIYTLNPMEGMPELKVGDTITVNGYIKNYKGTIEYASNGSEYVYIVAHKEAPKTSVVVDPRTLAEGAITGHMPVIVNAENKPDHFPMIAAAGLTNGAMLHQGSINLGTFTLQDYSKVVIYYATDWGEGTQAGLAAAKEQGFGRLGISAVDCNNVVNPTADHVFVGTQYTPAGGWVITAHEIDLTGIEYTGDIYVSADFLGGQFIIIDRVEFVY